MNTQFWLLCHKAQWPQSNRQMDKEFDIRHYLEHHADMPDAYDEYSDWVRSPECTADDRRDVIYMIEKQIKAMIDRPYDRLPSLNDAGWDKLEDLICIRELAVNELMQLSPLNYQRLSDLNDRLYQLTLRLHKKAKELWRAMNRGLEESSLERSNIYIDGYIDYAFEEIEDGGVLSLDDDGWYGSDFSFMLWLESELYQRDGYKSLHAHDVPPVDFKRTEEQAMRDLSDFMDDGRSWAEGYLLRPAFENICFCHAIHALATHYCYAVPDLLHMSNFEMQLKIEYVGCTTI